MAFTSAFVLFWAIWAVIFYMINPLWQTSQSEDGEVVPGTPASAPVDAKMRKKLILTTGIATAAFALAFSTVEFGWLSLNDVSFLTFPSDR